MVTSILIGIIVVCGAVVLDQISKILMMYYLSGMPAYTKELIPSFLSLKLTFNTGASFSMFSGRFWLLMLITLVATFIFIYMAKYAKIKKNPVYFFGIYSMIGGMLGNFVDRAFASDKTAYFHSINAVNHGVCDFIAFDFFPAVFNVADIFLTIGVILVIIDLIFLERKRELHGNSND